MAQAVQVKCRGCGQFVQRRADIFDPEFDDYAANEREYRQEWQEHDCQAEYTGYSTAPRPGEYEAWLATLSDAELVDELGEAGAAAFLAGPDELELAAAAELTAPVVEAEAEMVGLADVLRAAAETRAARVEPPTVERPPAVEVSAEDWARAMAAEVITAAEEITRTAPAPWIADRATMAPLFPEGSYGANRPVRRRDTARGANARGAARPAAAGHTARHGTGRAGADRAPVRPLEWPGSARQPGHGARQGRLDGAAGPGRPASVRPARLQVGESARVDQRRGVRSGLGSERTRRPGLAAQRRGGRRRGQWRLSRLLRWLQADDPRLAGRLERTARAVEWIEHQFVA